MTDSVMSLKLDGSNPTRYKKRRDTGYIKVQFPKSKLPVQILQKYTDTTSGFPNTVSSSWVPTNLDYFAA